MLQNACVEKRKEAGVDDLLLRILQASPLKTERAVAAIARLRIRISPPSRNVSGILRRMLSAGDGAERSVQSIASSIIAT